MPSRLLPALACILSLAAAAAAPPPRPIAAPKSAISDDQVRGWEAVGKVMIGAHAMRLARASCGAAMPLAATPEQLDEIVAAAVGAPLTAVEDGAAAPGWFDFVAAQRVTRLLGGSACDADTASFVGSELDGMVSLPADDLRNIKDLGKVPAARWAELAGTQHEHQGLAFGQSTEFGSTMLVANDVAKRCPASKARIDALLARVDESTARLVGTRVSDMIASQLKDPNADHMNADVREMAAGVLKDAGGCGTEQFEEWLADTETSIAALIEKASHTPPLPAAWRDRVR